MSDDCLSAVKIDQDLCSRCKVCISVCPFEAIEIQPDTGRLNVNIQKCQVCGICASACPVSAIDTSYYNYDELLDHLLAAEKGSMADTLVLMCRGNSPTDGDIDELLAANGLSGNGYIPMRVPCAGRIPTKFMFRALASGVKNIVSVQCQDEFCRMKEGTKIGTKRIILARSVAQQLGYPDNALSVVKYSRKVVRNNKECVGCGKCVFICPYDAIRSDSFSTPATDVDKCMGCGACQMVCPHNAIFVKGYEFENTLAAYCGAAKVLKEKGARPPILVLSCQWSEYSALDDPSSLKGRNALVLEVPCFKGLDPVHVANALRNGFDGVMAIVCSSTDCKLQKGRDTSERQMEVLASYLQHFGLIDRFELHELSPRCGSDFTAKLDDFHKKISSMPVQKEG